MLGTGTGITGGAMSIQIRSMLGSGVGQLRYEPTAKRIRAVLGGATVVDTTRAVLVWEPRRVVPSYAVPAEDVRGDLVPAGSAEAATADGMGVRVPDLSARPVLDPSVPFAAHSTEGDVVDVWAGGQTRPGAGFRPSDAELAGYVVLDFGAFDAWYEEDERNVAHPRKLLADTRLFVLPFRSLKRPVIN